MGNCSEKRRSVPELFGSSVFNDDVMQERLPKDVNQSLRKTIDQGKDLANKMRGMLLKARGREDQAAAQGMAKALRALAEAIGRCAE